MIISKLSMDLFRGHDPKNLQGTYVHTVEYVERHRETSGFRFLEMAPPLCTVFYNLNLIFCCCQSSSRSLYAPPLWKGKSPHVVNYAQDCVAKDSPATNSRACSVGTWRHYRRWCQVWLHQYWKHGGVQSEPQS